MTKPTTLLLLRFLSAPTAALLLLGVASCSSERRSLIGHAYDNVVARDNAYFLAREKMRATEEALYKARVNDYNRVLPLFPTLDEATVGRIAADMEDIIKKSSLPIQHRPGSDWTDDSYILVGKARFYKAEYEDAAKTFKYVNTTSTDPNARHEALIWLMRTFLATKELESASAVSDILDKEQGKPLNARELFLTRAEYYLLTGDQPKAIDQLERAIPLITPKNEQSRTRYILAQLYQAQGNDKKAYAELNQILKKNPPYELDFFSKLMLGQVSDLNLNDRARLDKYFAKLLKDTKNKEYQDKIYYEMARLNYRQQRYPEALALLEKSVRVPTPSRTQKSYTYLLAGRIYYENLQRYRLAAAYYDSTVQAMPKEAPEYAAISERAATLKDFAQQITSIETQDSLQALARLDTATLRTRLVAYAQAELDARRKVEEALAARQARDAQRDLQTSTGVSTARDGQPNIDPMAFAEMSTGAKWYFDNPASLSTARSEFVRRWGDRPLQDNWRFVTQASNSAVIQQGGSAPVSIAGAGGTSINAPGVASQVSAAEAPNQLAALVAGYRQNIPLTEIQLQASQAQVQEALYQLGGIYNQQLREPVPAAETYEKLLTRFPKGTHTAETLYILYLIYKNQNQKDKAEGYAERLRQAYPNSSYARLVADPEYLRRTSITNAQVSILVDSAFTFYKKQEFTKASAVLARAKKHYPENDLNDRVAFLNTLLSIRTQPPATAKAAVEKFAQDYPESALAPQAATLLTVYKDYESGKIVGALASMDKPVVSAFKPGEVENRMRIYYAENENPAARPVAPNSATTAAPLPTPGSTPASSPSRPGTTAPGEAPSVTPATAAPVTTPEVATTLAEAPAAVTPPVDPVKAARMAAAQARARGKKPPTPARTAEAPPVTDMTPPAAGLPTTPPPTVPTHAAPVAALTPSATPYKADQATAHVIALVFPKGAVRLQELPNQLEAYNTRYFKASHLQVAQQPLSDTQELVLIQGLLGAKVAQGYATKLRGPLSPLGKLRGTGYQTLVISIDNLPLLLQAKGLEEYQRFYQQNYR